MAPALAECRMEMDLIMSGVNIPQVFGCMVFNDAVMKQRLPLQTYESLNQVSVLRLSLFSATHRSEAANAASLRHR